jgi:Skp family chaperone for outer membrane proteins
MSRQSAYLLIAITFLTLGTLLGVLLAPRSIEAAKEPAKFSPARIAYVNIAKVMREYGKANDAGQRIIARRQEILEEVNVLKEELKGVVKLIEGANENTKSALLMKGREINRKIEDLDAKAQKELVEMADTTIVDVYQAIQNEVTDLAKELGLDVIECYPDGAQKDQSKATIATTKLQTPALYPFYIRKELDVTDEIVERLNKKHPPKKTGKP